MRKNILLNVGMLIAIVAASCSKPTQEEKKVPEQEPVVQSENELPAMSIKTLNGSSLDTKTLDGKVILILFQPDCDHCQREAKEIKDNMEAFREYSIFFITADQMPTIEKFAKDHDLLNRSNVSFGMTTVENVLNNFGPIPAPSIYIYADQQLKHKFNGEISIDKILEVL